MKPFFKSSLFFFLLVFAVNVFGQQTELDTGIELYKQGKNREAIQILEKLSKQKETKADAKVWNYLGLAYIEDNNLKKARKALEKANSLNPQNSAIKANLGYVYLLSRKLNEAQAQLTQAIEIEPNNFLAYYIRGSSFLWERKLDKALADADKTIVLQPNFPSGYILRADILTALFGQKVTNGSAPRDEIDFLRYAIETLEICAKNCQNADLSKQEERLESLKVFYEYFSKNKTTNNDLNSSITGGDLNTSTGVNVTSQTEANVTPLKILTKPRPSYTDRARQAGISGTITLCVLFGANGKILNILPVKIIGYGLDEEAIRATRKMTFEPKTENGKPVSVAKLIQYSFTIY